MQRRRAFTLMELLVVIGVIAVLLAILMPAIGWSKKRVRTVVCTTNERTLAQTTRMYVADWGRVFLGGGHGGPLGVWDYQLFGGGKTKTFYYTNNGRQDAVDKVRWCPETPLASQQLTGTANTQWNCEQKVGQNSTGSYAFNGWLYSGSDKDAIALAGPTWTSLSSLKITQVGNESVVPIFVDATWHDMWPTPSDAFPTNLDNPGPAAIGTGSNTLARAAMDRHAKAVNVVFIDGHAETVKLPKLWALAWSANWRTPQNLPVIR